MRARRGLARCHGQLARRGPGGQHLDGVLTVPQLSRQLAAEGVAKIVIVSDNPQAHRRQSDQDPKAEGVEVFDRRDLDAVEFHQQATGEFLKFNDRVQICAFHLDLMPIRGADARFVKTILQV